MLHVYYIAFKTAYKYNMVIIIILHLTPSQPATRQTKTSLFIKFFSFNEYEAAVFEKRFFKTLLKNYTIICNATLLLTDR